ncbi:helix-turn-helix domain-containing protein [Actinomadura rayongensis]|uniref:Helix-turn-helix domain-containing protein n=1 Tax=Actinomadura rayongensis TaxID=1429076 RepID=A0A6I4W0Q9_9ACTN|nr:helix-turn-helix domain-containing protein [Actinomadura rayongensis]
MGDNELGDFLRARREAVRPADVGLPEGPRRRTPGLRRAELATVAGISVEYLTRLEQGRDRNPSAQVMGALADALRMTPDERIQFRYVAKASAGGFGMLCPNAGSPPPRAVRPGVRAVLDRLEPAPAVVLNALDDVLAWTDGFAALAGPLGFLDGDGPNLHRYVFTDPRARTAFPDWDEVADAAVAHLRMVAVHGDPHVDRFLDELTVLAGAPFTTRMEALPGPPRPAAARRVAHPEAGVLRLAYETLDVPDGDAQRIVLYLPGDEHAARALDRLAGRRPGVLRAVGD